MIAVTATRETPVPPATSVPDASSRNSRRRAQVLRALIEHGDFVSAQTLHAGLAAAGANIGLTTVYRALTSLHAKGRLDCVRQDDGTRLYRHRPGPQHRHYLVCRICARSEPLDSHVVEEWAEFLARSSGYAQLRHTLEVDGICPACEVNVVDPPAPAADPD
jgi:Fur family ferric uptake transcriptional regulator